MAGLISGTEIVALLAEAIGKERASEAVTDTSKKLGYNTDAFDYTQTMKIFETMSATPGFIGTVARFAKTRAIIRFK